ncbi:MAG: relaxase domain-containing protein [Microbacteriaceae bacterium]
MSGRTRKPARRSSPVTSPGRWIGSGMAGLEGIATGDVVTEAHMLNLFGSGRHPLAEQLRADAAQAGEDVRGQERAARLGGAVPGLSGGCLGVPGAGC